MSEASPQRHHNNPKTEDQSIKFNSPMNNELLRNYVIYKSLLQLKSNKNDLKVRLKSKNVFF